MAPDPEILKDTVAAMFVRLLDMWRKVILEKLVRPLKFVVSLYCMEMKQ